MNELLNILKDIKSGALPASEIPGFIAWLIWRPWFLFWLVTVAIGIALWIANRLADSRNLDAIQPEGALGAAVMAIGRDIGIFPALFDQQRSDASLLGRVTRHTIQHINCLL